MMMMMMLTDSRALSVVTTHTHTARSLPSLAMFTECQSRDTCVDDSCWSLSYV